MADIIKSANMAFRIKDIRKIKKEAVNTRPCILLYGYLPTESPEIIPYLSEQERDECFQNWIKTLEDSKE